MHTSVSPNAASGDSAPTREPHSRLVFIWILRIVVILQLATLLMQAMTAGGMLARIASEHAFHSSGAAIVTGVSLAALIATILAWRPGHGAGWPVYLAAVILVGVVAQAMLGESGLVQLHVPIGVALVILTTWLAVAAWTKQLSGHRHPASAAVHYGTNHGKDHG